MPARVFGSGNRNAFLLIVAAGLAVRVLHVLQAVHSDPMFYYPVMDAQFHHQWAMAIVRGGWLADMPFFRAPLYPYFLALVYKVFGVNLFAPRLVQALVGAVSCGLVFALGVELFNRRVGLWAGIAAVFYPLLVYFDAELLIPNLLVFLVLLGMLLLVWCRRTDQYWFAPGIVWGMAAITRPNALVFAVLAVSWLWFEYRKRLWKRLGPFVLAVVAVIVPVTIRNRVVSGELIPIAWQAGTNFAIGNNPESDGMTAVLPGTRKDWWGGFYDVKRLAEEALGQELAYSEIDRYWLGQGLEFWKRAPGRALGLFLRKAYLFFGGYEVANNRDIYFFTRFTFLRFLVLRLPMLQFPFGLLVPFAVLGVVLGRKSWRRLVPVYLFIAGYSLSLIVFFVTARYRMPLVPFLILLGVSGGIGLYQQIRKGRGWRMALILLGLIVFLNANLGRARGANQAQVYSMLAGHEAKMGRFDAAEELLDKAREADSSWADQYFVAGMVARKRGDEAGAEQAFLTALRYDSTQADYWVYLGDLKLGSGKPDSARACYEQALRFDPHSAFGHCHLGNVYYEQGEMGRALESYARASELIPDYVVAVYNVGLVYFRMGDTARAMEHWERVVRIDPKHDLARRVSGWLQKQ